jgi:hypothetical protein
MITIEFEFIYEGQMFRDAVVLPDNHDLNGADIDAIKLKRFEDWKQSIKPTDEPEED